MRFACSIMDYGRPMKLFFNNIPKNVRQIGQINQIKFEIFSDQPPFWHCDFHHSDIFSTKSLVFRPNATWLRKVTWTAAHLGLTLNFTLQAS
jgi:hypothetical protein